jgi:hypothetical protein
VEVGDLATRQHGVVGRGQLLALGLSEHAVDRWISGGRLHPVHAGVYAVGHRRVSRRGEWHAAVIACGPGAMLSHFSAAALWGFGGERPGLVHVTAPGRRRNRQPRIAVHRPRRLAREDRAHHDGIAATSVPRTLLDLAAIAGPQTLERLAEEADRLRLLELDALRALRRRCRGHRGVRRLDALLLDPVEPADVRSELERRFLRLCERHAVPHPSVNVLVEGLLVDCLWTRERLVVELDSWSFHRTRAAWERDRARDSVLRMAGYEVHRLSWRRIAAEPERVAAEVRELLRRRSPLGARHPGHPTYNARTPPA